MSELSVLDTAAGPYGLELAMQELEPLEAPGFWSGFKTGVTISGIGVASYAASVAVVTT